MISSRYGIWRLEMMCSVYRGGVCVWDVEGGRGAG